MHISDEKIAEIKSAVNIVDVISECVELKKTGVDFFGSCPFHNEKTPSFSVSAEKQIFYCFGCGAGGDVVEFVTRKSGVSFTDAVKRLAVRAGIGLPDSGMCDNTYQYRTPRAPGEKIRGQRSEIRGQEKKEKQSELPPDVWRLQAEKLVTWAHDQLLENDEQLAWLLDRGICLDTVKNFRLGWNPGRDGRDLWRPRETWGLATVMKENKTGTMVKKKLWIPRGLVIPEIGGQRSEVRRIRIRRPEENPPRYYVLPGSCMDMMYISADHRAVLVLEAELDGEMCHSRGGGVCSVLALGSASAKPGEQLMEKLRNAAVILLAQDFDDAGAKAMKWWKDEFHQAKTWPVPEGTDPGEAFQAGIDIKAWISAGLPSAWGVGGLLLNDQKKGREIPGGVEGNRGQRSEVGNQKTEDRGQRTEGPAVEELAGLLRRHPVVVHNSPKRTYIAAPVT